MKKYSVAFSHQKHLSWDIKLLVHRLFPEKLCVAMVLLSSDLSYFEKNKKKNPAGFQPSYMIIGVHISFQISILSSLYKYPEAELLDHMVIVVVVFEAPPYWFPW